MADDRTALERLTTLGALYEQCPTCDGHPKRPSTRVEGGSLACRHCNRIQTFNFMRDRGTDCTCPAARSESCLTCDGRGIVARATLDPHRRARRRDLDLTGDGTDLRWERPRIVSTRPAAAGTPKPKGWEA